MKLKYWRTIPDWRRLRNNLCFAKSTGCSSDPLNALSTARGSNNYSFLFLTLWLSTRLPTPSFLPMSLTPFQVHDPFFDHQHQSSSQLGSWPSCSVFSSFPRWSQLCSWFHFFLYFNDSKFISSSGVVFFNNISCLPPSFFCLAKESASVSHQIHECNILDYVTHYASGLRMK